MLRTFSATAMKGYNIRATSRCFSTAAGIKDQFEAAWSEVNANKTVAAVPQPENKAEYGAGYYQANYQRLNSGYVHPYHSNKHPINFTSAIGAWNIIAEATGPEQVSPHYESLSRSRRGIIFLFAYIGTITTIAQLGGWNHNEWIRGLIFHHEFLLAFYIGYIEIRHFTWLPGPKFTVFYDVFSKYEFKQLMNQWADTIEEQQHEHLQESKEQIEYMRIHTEYQFVKKRALQNYLINSRLNLEASFRNRTVNILNSIVKFENQNLTDQLTSVTDSALAETLEELAADPEATRRSALDAALDGIRKGTMDYASDTVLPLLNSKIQAKTSQYKSLSEEDESSLLSLSSKQRQIIANTDKTSKNGYLTTVPQVHSPTLKSHDKFKRFVDTL